MKYDILNRFSGAVQFSAEIEWDDAPTLLKIGFAVEAAVKAKASLRGANLRGADLNGSDLSGAGLSHAHLSRADLSRAYLTGADLSHANLAGANLSGADLTDAYLRDTDLYGADLSGTDLTDTDLIDGGQRSDGYRFVGWTKDGVLQILAGCHSFSITDARAYWDKTRGGTPLGDETFAILNHIETVARIRKLVMP